MTEPIGCIAPRITLTHADRPRDSKTRYKRIERLTPTIVHLIVLLFHLGNGQAEDGDLNTGG